MSINEITTLEDRHQAIFDQLKSLARAIKEVIGQECEVVIHDFSDLEHSIIWIEGNVTNRETGGSLTDLGLAKIRAGETEDLYNYITYDNGRTLRSSSTFLRDSDGQVFGALCINVDITPLLAIEHTLRTLTKGNDSQGISEHFSDDIHEIVNMMIEEATVEIGKPLALMSKEEKVAVVAMLDSKGAFEVKKAVPYVAGRLGVSRYTVYNYINESRACQEVGPADNDHHSR